MMKIKTRDTMILRFKSRHYDIEIQIKTRWYWDSKGVWDMHLRNTPKMPCTCTVSFSYKKQKWNVCNCENAEWDSPKNVDLEKMAKRALAAKQWREHITRRIARVCSIIYGMCIHVRRHIISCIVSWQNAMISLDVCVCVCVCVCVYAMISLDVCVCVCVWCVGVHVHVHGIIITNPMYGTAEI